MPLKIQNANAFNDFFAVVAVGAFVLCSDGPRPACSPARHGPGDTPAVVPITDTHHKRHLPAQYGRRSEPTVITAINRHRRLWANGELPVFSGQPATALQQLKLSMRQKRNGLGLCAAMGPCNPQATHTDGPLTERRLRVQVALAETDSVDARCLVSAGILGFLAASPGGPRMRSRSRPLRA